MKLDTALFASLTAWLASSPGRISRVAVWKSCNVSVDFLVSLTNPTASSVSLVKMSFMKSSMIFIALPVMARSRWTCFKTRNKYDEKLIGWLERNFFLRAFVDDMSTRSLGRSVIFLGRVEGLGKNAAKTWEGFNLPMILFKLSVYGQDLGWPAPRTQAAGAIKIC